ncbi:MAG: peptide MFS transporter [bacterium]
MFKGHPKGLIAAALANMGERFGFYTMMAILVLFLQTKFNLNPSEAGAIYSTFYFGIYILALVGGIIADRTKKYKATIFSGIVLMAVGYVILSIPSPTPVPEAGYTFALVLSCFALFVIAFGNGLFKGNLQALVGQMYDDPKYAAKRDSGFQLFYMFINVGAIFAPLLAVGIRNWWVQSQGFLYDQSLPDICNRFVSTGGAEGGDRLVEFANQFGYAGTDMMAFANEYLNVFTQGFNYAFAAAIAAMAISLIIYIVNAKRFPDPAAKKAASADNSNAVQMSAQEIRQRLYALFAVFGVVIFFWFSFHQNGLTLTFFAKDYVDLSAIRLDLGFVELVGAELFQSFNPLFVVCLTPVVMAIFGWLSAKGKEPSTPKKIAIGMGIAALGFVVMALGSIGLPTRAEAIATGYAPSVTPWLLVGTYFILTVAELFISPLGISFVSKVAPPHLQGLMQGLWLCATAIGNQLLFIGAIFYDSISMTATWSIFVGACCISMIAMLAMVKWLERVTK